MSINYYLKKPSKITFSKLKTLLKKKDSIKRFGIKYTKSSEENKTQFCVTDEESYLWVYGNYENDNKIYSFARYGENWAAEATIIPVLSEILETIIVSENDADW
jgi:hypothetical protein